jgi:hypothetical protein
LVPTDESARCAVRDFGAHRAPEFAAIRRLPDKDGFESEGSSQLPSGPDILFTADSSESPQYRQTPIPPGGTIIKGKWLATYDSINPQGCDRVVMSWDIALSEAETGDYSACVVLLIRNEAFYILEVIRGRFPFDTLKRTVMDVKRRYGSTTLLIEDSPISRGLIQSLREQSINVTTYNRKPTNALV